MACETCVEMTLAVESMTQEALRLKRTNKIIRTVNGMLRRDRQTLHTGTDELFLAFCDTDKLAELAMGELWGSGDVDCGPQDYDFIVKRCLVALREYNERHTHPEQTHAEPNANA